MDIGKSVKTRYRALRTRRGHQQRRQKIHLTQQLIGQVLSKTPIQSALYNPQDLIHLALVLLLLQDLFLEQEAT